MKYFKTFEGFKKDYMKKIDLKDFKKIKKGAKLMYMGGKVEVLDNNGYVLKLKGDDDRIFMVNKSQFDHGGMTMRESVNEASSRINITGLDSKEIKGLKKWGDAKVAGPGVYFTFLDKDKEEILNYLNNIDSADFDKSLLEGVKESFDTEVTEAAQIPSNIEKFAKERGVLRDVKQLARWAEKAGLGIRGGTAIGKGYDTLVLDLTYNGAEIYFDTYTGKIKVNRQPVNSWKTFSKAVNESSERDGTEASDGKHKHDDHLEEDLEAMWKKAYGEKLSTKYPGVAKIIRQRKITDKREIARIWQETYGENFKEEYPAMWDMMSK